MLKTTKAICIALVIALLATIGAPLAFASDTPSGSIKNVSYEIEEDKIIFSVTTVAGDFARIRCGLSTSTKDNLAIATTYTVNADGDYVWVLKTDVPGEDTTYVFDLRSAETGKYIKDYFYYSYIVIDESKYNTVVDGWYISLDGGIRFFVGDWVATGTAYPGIEAPSGDPYPNFCEIGVGGIDEDFENITKEDYEYYGEIITFTKTTVGKAGYTMYYVATERIELYEFQTNKKLYYILFVYDDESSPREDLTKFAARAMDSLIITDDRVPCAIKDVKHEASGNKAVFTVTTKAGDYSRLRCGLSTSTKDNLAFTNSYTVNADGDYVWTITTDIPAENTELIFDLRSSETNKYLKDYFRYNFAVADSANANTLVDGWYTSKDGGFKFYADDWEFFGANDVMLINSREETTSMCQIKIFDAVEQEVFESLTSDDFEPLIGETPTTCLRTHIGNARYTMYYVQSELCEFYMFQANGKQYAIWFATVGEDREALTAFAKRAMGSMIITNDDEPYSHIEKVSYEIVDDKLTFTVITVAGDFNRLRCDLDGVAIKTADTYTVTADGKYEWKITTSNIVYGENYAFDLRSSETGKYIKDYFYWRVTSSTGPVVDGWYTSKDGGFKFYVEDWVYFDQYGITLAQNPYNLPSNCAAIFVSDADSYEVFEAKTQADFELVMSEPAIELKKTTIGYSEFTMYYFKSETYESYVFQANGKKYYINFIHGSGHRDDLTEFAASVMDSIIITNDFYWYPVPAE